MAKRQKDKRVSIVDESLQVKKAREKLRKKLESTEEKVTKQALERKSMEIHRWIAKNSSDRVVLVDKEIALFDENRHAAKVSQKVIAVAEKIQKDAQALQNLLSCAQKNDLESKTQTAVQE